MVTLTGCAVIRIDNAGGTQDISIQPLGIQSVSRSASNPQLVRVSALGVSSTSRGVDIGVRNEEVVVAPEGCHAIFVVDSKAQAEAASKLAKVVEEECVIRR